jgi:hypothetical protein
MADPTQDEIDAAYHEAAHAIAHIEMGYPLEYVSIDPPQDCKLGGTKGMIAPPELEPKLKARKSLTSAEIDKRASLGQYPVTRSRRSGVGASAARHRPRPLG